ncbi:Non-repetitive/WGA-negative nucleoporin C-terminal-domain-containing protein [Copromyces sp. CBS 386.78]|nr:Non-repetitive/WGA-negative nucleoporin C-terminal-domain-containing protein [Copromyces sp. CBS 386.78]
MNPATPMRQVPGAFLNTPAAPRTDDARRYLDSLPEKNTARPALGGFGSYNAGGAGVSSGPVTGPVSGPVGGAGAGPVARPVSQVPVPMVPAQARTDLPPVAKAARRITNTLLRDENYPDVDSYARAGSSSDYDMYSTDDAPGAPFKKTHMHPIPDQVFERLNRGEVNTQLGLFADINYAWAAIDSSLFLWDYTHPNPELIGYEDATTTISAVALVPPKPGVFVSNITHILVVATGTEIVLLGVSATPTPSGSKTVSLYQTKMAVHRGSTDVSIIVGTASGRIFFGGYTDTDIYELLYQQEERWFLSRCAKVNHTHPGWTSVVPNLPVPMGFLGHRDQEHLVQLVVDDTRKLLYSLSDKSTIRTYFMEPSGKLTKVIEKNKVSCLSDMTHMVDLNRNPLLNERVRIVSLSAISSQEASKSHLMALTNTGCRLFLTATSAASYMLNASANLAPQSMQVQYIKFPPTSEDQQVPLRNETNTAVAYAPAPAAAQDQMSGLLSESCLGQRFAPGYFFDAVRSNESRTDLLFVSAPDVGRLKQNAVLRYVEQGTLIPLGDGSRVLAIGLTGKPFAAAKQPLGFGNELAVQFDHTPSEFAVLTNTGIHIVRRRRFIDIFANAIRVASGDEDLDNKVKTFTTINGRVEMIAAALAVACGQGGDSRRAVDPLTEDRARSIFINYGGQPKLADADVLQAPEDNVQLSARHDALVLYLARLTRTLWKSKVIAMATDSASGGFTVGSAIPISKLTTVQESVQRLRRFLEQNKSLIQGLAGPSDRVSSRQEEIALQLEHQSLHALRQLMDSVSEGISFVLMLFDERVTDIFMRLDDTSKQQLQNLTYEGLFSQDSGKELAKVLVKAIVNRNIANGANVETVADALRRRCGTFCSPDDVVIFKAQEQLQRASESLGNPNLMRTLLAESLRLFDQVAGSLTMTNLRNAVEQYINLKYYAGAIQLCLVVAREKDRGNSALSWFNEGKPANDPREKAFNDRTSCYSLIHEVLDRLEIASASEPDIVDGRPTLAATKRAEAYSVVNSSEDEVFHLDLYDWYIEKGWTDRMLAIDSPHVITYLQRLAAVDAQHADLLCRFYTQRSRFFEAAQVQADLAKSDFPLGIKERITLLSRAKANASVTTVGVSRQQQQLLNHEVTDLLEIAHIQDDLLERLRADPRIVADKLPDIEKVLDGPVQGLSTLFNDFADQAGYYDLCLLIYNSADYQNPHTINETWENLISQIHFETEQKQEAWRLVEAGEALPDGFEGLEAAPPMPYEAVVSQIQSIAHRTSFDSLIFPVDTLLPMVCGYAINNHQDASIGADPCWPVAAFLQLGVPHTLIARVLENMFDAQEAPFVSKHRKSVVQWINLVVDSWIREIEHRGSASGKNGDGAITTWVAELLTRAEEALVAIAAGTRDPAQMASLTATRRDTRDLKRKVEILSQAEAQGSLLFSTR